MSSKKFLPLFAVGVLTIAAVFGAFTYRSVFAQAATPTPGTSTATTPDASAQPFPGKGRPDGMRGGGVTDTNLAAALGITVEELQAAETSANTEALKQAVAAGLITQAQADQLAANSANGAHPGGFRIPGNSTIDYNALLANALGITTDELKAAQQQAFTTAIDQAVTAGTLTQAQADLMKARNSLANNAAFQSSMNSAYTAALKQAVTDGVITQAQADQILAEQPTINVFGHGGFGGGPGGRGGRGGHGGPGDRMPFDQNGTPPTTTTPDSSTTTGGNS
jgi:hypothetical protein